jgi:hypothetical protein
MMGIRFCPEQLLYTSVASFDMKVADAVSRVLTLQHRLLLTDLCLVCNAYFAGEGMDLVLELPHGSSRNGRLTKNDALTLLSEAPEVTIRAHHSPPSRAAARKASLVPSRAIIGVYDVREARDVFDGFLSAAVLAGKSSKDPQQLHWVESDPASWGAVLNGSIADSLEWMCKTPDDPYTGLFGLVILKTEARSATEAQRTPHRLFRTKSGWSSDDEEN